MTTSSAVCPACHWHGQWDETDFVALDDEHGAQLAYYPACPHCSQPVDERDTVHPRHATPNPITIRQYIERIISSAIAGGWTSDLKAELSAEIASCEVQHIDIAEPAITQIHDTWCIDLPLLL